MSPFHPKLREALIRHPEHQQRGLTGSLLLEFEKLVTQLFFVIHYPGPEPPGPDVPCYVITQSTLAQLSDADVPNSVITKLQQLLDQEFRGGAAFGEALRQVLGDADFNQYKEVIFRLAVSPVCTITEHRLERMKAAGIPASVLKKLKPLQDQPITGRDNFRRALQQHLSAEEFDQCGEALVQHSVDPVSDLIEQIIRFRNQFMPRFDEVVQDWQRSQEAALRGNLLSLNIPTQLKNALKEGWFWLLGVAFRKRQYKSIESSQQP
ncbi:MAG: hypothetical protein D6681_15110 [Calditrichaeota bacterium]|nr:MAG: hypothetical protein D6681_15110 [Calditrichota bacterium]